MSDSTRRTVETDWGNANPAGVIAPAQATQDNGYAAVKPPYQEHNWIFQLVTSMLQSAEKNGIMEWRSTTEYSQNGLTFGSDGKKYQSQVSANIGNDPVLDNGTNWVPWLETSDNPFINTAMLQYVEPAGTNGIPAPTGQTVIPLNETVINNITGSALNTSTGAFELLPAGTYKVYGSCCYGAPGSSVQNMRLNIFDGSDVIATGLSSAANTDNDDGYIIIDAVFTTTATKNISFRIRTSSNLNTLGNEISDGSQEKYAVLEIWKIA